LPGTVGLVGRVAAPGAAGCPERRKARRGRSRAGQATRSLAADRVDPGAVFALGRFDLQALFLAQGTADEPSDTMGLPAGGFHQFSQRGTVGLLQQNDDLSLFAAFARLAGGLFPALRGLLGARGLTARLRLGVATWGLCAAGAALLVAFLAGSASPWIRAQIRPIAVLEVLNFLTGLRPGRLFQTSTSRSAGQLAANAANSAALVNRSAPERAVASSAVAWAVMLLSLSIVNVVIVGMLLSR